VNGRLDDKVALVSGGARGMGASHARMIVAEGGRVVIGDVAVDEGRALEHELGSDSAAFVHLDVTDTASWEQAVRETESRFGGLHVLVNNAGILRSGPIETYPDSDWELVQSINVGGTFKGIRASVDAMRRNSPASVINISSTAGLKAFPAEPAYTASKWAIRGLTKSAAIELAPWGIRVNSIHPGNINTTMIEGLYDGFPHVPMGRPGEPAEISRLVIFLASDESSFSTGSEFVADGGEVAGLPAALLRPGPE
jgi:3alpha(or 20beta)-hydroxysteroid dehydrogenase